MTDKTLDNYRLQQVSVCYGPTSLSVHIEFVSFLKLNSQFRKFYLTLLEGVLTRF